MPIALPVRSYCPVAWAAVCRSTKRPVSALPTTAEVVAASVTIRLGTPSSISAVDKSLEGRLGLQKVAVSSRPIGGHTEGCAQIGVGAILPPIASELSEKPGLFSWVIGKDPLALQWCALILMLRIGYRLLSKYKELFKAPVLSFTASYSQKDGPFEHSPKEDRVYDLPGPLTRDVRSESDHGCHLM
jgi:hypothetical protein